MTDLERDLRLLGGSLLWPESPDLASAVRASLEEAPALGTAWWRRRSALAASLAVLLAAFAAAMAVPQARTAILRVFGIGSVRIELVDELPAVPPRSELRGLGSSVTLAAARDLFPYPLVVPDAAVLGPYDDVLFGTVPFPQVSFVWLAGNGEVRLLVSILPGRFVGAGYVKLAGPGTHLEELTVDGRRMLWITGDAHGFGLDSPGGGSSFEEIRLAGNTLLVDRGETTIRIEGDLSRARALEVAQALKTP
jgi:hypothetical protein